MRHGTSVAPMNRKGEPMERKAWIALAVLAAAVGCSGKNKPGGGDDDDDNGTPTPTPCVEQWVCSSWETDGSSDAATRTCVDEAACGTTDDKPVETATLPALDENYYRCNVEPILDEKCSHLGCHGQETGRGLRTYARGRLRISGETFTEPGCLSAGTQKPSESCIGSIECVCWSIPHHPKEDRRNYDSARGFALYADGTPIAAADMDDSEMLSQPRVGGKPHVNVHVFQQGDADYTTIKDWLNGATQASCNTSN